MTVTAVNRGTGYEGSKAIDADNSTYWTMDDGTKIVNYSEFKRELSKKVNFFFRKKIIKIETILYYINIDLKIKK